MGQGTSYEDEGIGKVLLDMLTYNSIPSYGDRYTITMYLSPIITDTASL